MSSASAPGGDAASEARSHSARSPARPGAGLEFGPGDVDPAPNVATDVWETRDLGLYRKRYADDCIVHTPGGPIRGREAIVQAAVDALAASADETVVVEDVARREPAPGRVHTSHRITHCGDGRAIATTLVDRRLADGLVVEEWRVCDDAGRALRSGRDPFALAAAHAAADGRGDPARHAWRSAWIAAVREGAASSAPPGNHPAAIPAEALRLALAEDLFGRAARACAPAVETRWPTGRRGWGRDCWVGRLMQLRSLLHGARLRLDDWAARPLSDGDVAVALRWSLAGVHAGAGAWGAPSGRDILILAISHCRLRGAVILQDVTVFDEAAVLRQAAGGLGAGPPGDAPAAPAMEASRGERA